MTSEPTISAVDSAFGHPETCSSSCSDRISPAPSGPHRSPCVRHLACQEQRVSDRYTNPRQAVHTHLLPLLLLRIVLDDLEHARVVIREHDRRLGLQLRHRQAYIQTPTSISAHSYATN